MGLFFATYRVEHKEGSFFPSWNTVLKNVSLDEAEKYINNKTSGFFAESRENYQIVKE